MEEVDKRDREFLTSKVSPDWHEGSRGVVRIADLFCGCGGMTLGLAQVAHEMDLACEVSLALDVDEFAVNAYRANFGLAYKCDIKEWFDGPVGKEALTALEKDRRRLVEEAGLPHVLLGGPPCQGHSDLNNHTRRDDPRNALYARMARAARVLEPDITIIENVPAVVHDKNSVVKVTIEALEDLGYCTAQDIVSLLNVGLPQTRTRHILIASKLDEFDPDLALEKLTNKRTRRSVGWALHDLDLHPQGTGMNNPGRPRQRSRDRIDWLHDNNEYVLPDTLRPPCHKNKSHTYKSVYGRMRWDEPANTITTGFISMGQGCYVHPKARRTITPREAARLQGFPDFFAFATEQRTKLANLIGNAVPPLLTIALGRMLLEVLLKSGKLTSS